MAVDKKEKYIIQKRENKGVVDKEGKYVIQKRKNKRAVDKEEKYVIQKWYLIVPILRCKRVIEGF